MSKFNYTAHKEMWTWLSENPAAYKGMWPGWKVNGGKYEKQYQDCFACDACDFVCQHCPLIWPEDGFGVHECWDSDGLFDLCRTAENMMCELISPSKSPISRLRKE